MITPTEQRDRFTVAVDILGGNRSAARVMGCSESTIRHIKAGLKPLHKGWLKGTAAALLDHAQAARTLERQINPLFAGNLTEEQAIG